MDLKKLNELVQKKQDKKRVGCGPGSGHGKTSCRGHNGSKSRSGGRRGGTFEGGPMPLFRKIPKRGFSNYLHKDFFEVVNVEDLNAFEPGTEITPEVLRATRVVRRNLPIKILGNGTIDRALTVKAAAFTKSAIEKIQSAGGQVEVVN